MEILRAVSYPIQQLFARGCGFTTWFHSPKPSPASPNPYLHPAFNLPLYLSCSRGLEYLGGEGGGGLQYLKEGGYSTTGGGGVTVS